MCRFAVALAVLSVILVGIVLVGCAKPPFYVGGIGGNLKPVKRNDDGTWLLAPLVESDKEARDGQRRRLSSLPASDTPVEAN